MSALPLLLRRVCGLLVLLSLPACGSRGTGTLPAELAQRFAAEGVLRRADDQVFRYTYYSRSTRSSRWEERDASILVTPRTIYIFKNEKSGLEVTPATRREVVVRREGERVIVSAGSGQSRVSWSFRPPAEAEGWAQDMRAVLEVEE